MKCWELLYFDLTAPKPVLQLGRLSLSLHHLQSVSYILPYATRQGEKLKHCTLPDRFPT